MLTQIAEPCAVCVDPCAVCAEAPPGHIQEAHRQIEQALQTADHQIEALRACVTKKNAQLSDAKLQLEHIRVDMHDIAVSQRHAPPSLPDTESSEQTGDALLCLDNLWSLEKSTLLLFWWLTVSEAACSHNSLVPWESFG